MDTIPLLSLLAQYGISDIDALTPRAIRIIHKYFRDTDESELFPINGNFNVTERAIRHLKEFRNGYADSVCSYYLSLDQEISRIVNAQI